jgi:hypothetical protein
MNSRHESEPKSGRQTETAEQDNTPPGLDLGLEIRCINPSNCEQENICAAGESGQDDVRFFERKPGSTAEKRPLL